jgi:hypothetical protein
MSERDPETEALLTAACDEVGLPDYYRDCVRPILRAPRDEWPSCCGGGCEPCLGTLVAIAERVLARKSR